MTENEAIKMLEYTKRSRGMPFQGDTWKPNAETIALDIAIKALEEIQQYRSIGTVEECREAVERQKAKIPYERLDRYTDLTKHYYCPVCGKYFGQAINCNSVLLDTPKYCSCGQRLKWWCNGG